MHEKYIRSQVREFKKKQLYCDTPYVCVYKIHKRFSYTLCELTHKNKPTRGKRRRTQTMMKRNREKQTHVDVLTHVLLRLSSKHNWIGYIYSYTLDSHKGSSSGSDDINIARTSSYMLLLLLSLSHTYIYVASHQYGCEGIKTAFKHTSTHKRSLERKTVW